MATWDDVPHLSAKDKEELLQSIPPFERDARSKGKPMLGAGAIYPVSESEVTVEPFRIPGYWPRVYGLDIGWNRTAAVWGAWDTDSDVVYIYSEYYRGQVEPSVHADAIKGRGAWVPGVIDPSARGRGVSDGTRLLEQFSRFGLQLFPADNSVDSGILSVWQRLSTGGLKVFSSCQNWFGEFRIYRRDENGKIVKKDDHLMDATRYLIMSGLSIANTEPRSIEEWENQFSDHTRNEISGY
jgi:hypothetical protein